MSIKHLTFEDTINETVIITMAELEIYISKSLSMDTQPNTNSTMGDCLDIEMVSSEIIYMNQLLTIFHLGCTKRNMEVQKKNMLIRFSLKNKRHNKA